MTAPPSSGSNPLPLTAWNAYLVLFAVDGLVQLIVVVAGFLAPLSAMSRLILILATFALLGLWIGFRRMPWRVLVPVAMLAWQTGGLMPLPAVALNLTGVAAIGGILQVTLAALMAAGFRRPAFPLGEEVMRPGPEVSVLTSGLRVVTLGGLAVAGVIIQVALMGWSLSLVTDGYVSVDSEGLSTAHRACSKDGTTVHLVGAVHIGQSEGYDALMAGIPEGALLLAEGVTDADGLLGEGFGYDKLAKRLGLVPQRGPGEGPETEGEGRFRVRSADVDVNTFDPATLALLRDVGAILNAKDPVAAYLKSLSKTTAVTEDTLKTVVDDVLTRRNAHLLSVLDEVVAEEEVVVVPWGAMHLREVGREVVKRGFVCGEPRSIRMIEWRTVREALTSGRGAPAPPR